MIMSSESDNDDRFSDSAASSRSGGSNNRTFLQNLSSADHAIVKGRGGFFCFFSFFLVV